MLPVTYYQPKLFDALVTTSSNMANHHPSPNQAGMTGVLSCSATLEHEMNAGINSSNTTTTGAKGHPRTSNKVIDNIDRLKAEMNIRENTQMVLCNRCEGHIKEYGLPAGLLENVELCPWITFFGRYDGVDLTTYKDVGTHLQRHVASELHQQVRTAEAIRYLQSKGIGADIVNTFNKQRHRQLQTVLRASVRGVQEQSSQQSLEDELFFLNQNGVDVGNSGHSRSTIGRKLYRLVAREADDELRHFLSTLNPYTGELPPVGVKLDKYTDKTTSQKLLLVTLVVIINGERRIIMGDVIKIAAEESDGIAAGGGHSLYLHLFGNSKEANVVGPKTGANTRERRGLGHRFDVSTKIATETVSGGKTQAGMYLTTCIINTIFTCCTLVYISPILSIIYLHLLISLFLSSLSLLLHNSWYLH